MSDRPRYTHDCENCSFLGQYLAPADVDLYFCPQGGMPTVIARYSGEPSDYVSGMQVTGLPVLDEARCRALLAGLIG